MGVSYWNLIARINCVKNFEPFKTDLCEGKGREGFKRLNKEQGAIGRILLCRIAFL